MGRCQNAPVGVRLTFQKIRLIPLTSHSSNHRNIVGYGALGRALAPFVPPEAPIVFFCVKAFDLEQALREQANKWPRDWPFVTLSNGYIQPVVEKCRAVLGTRPARLGMTTMGATVDATGTLSAYTEGSMTAWGGTGQGERPTQSELSLVAANAGWQWVDDIRPLLRRKWTLNVVFNTLSGALSLPSNGALVHHREEAEALLAEAMALADELWADLPWDVNEAQMRKIMWKLAETSKNNENSMARDVRLGRPNESAYLAGLGSGRSRYPLMSHYHSVLAVRA